MFEMETAIFSENDSGKGIEVFPTVLLITVFVW